ncbi:MAG TPA: nucleoside phosphorylase, partial [Gammaproteobacteria bacterium]|nr:nucleoside phosphorylase [Gammaproteobacteria bacterium]
RAKEIAERFDNVTVQKHSRGHDIYFGTIKGYDDNIIEVASVSSGMGTPSVDIILNELIRLGAKRFLRVGTSGSLQYQKTKLGDLVIANGAVRDEGASLAYLPPEFPAIASFEMLRCAYLASRKLNMKSKTHIGTLHTKDSLYAREFKSGPSEKENARYHEILQDAGIIASEMEASVLFVICACYNQKLQKYGEGYAFRIFAGAVCAIVSNGPDWVDEKQIPKITKDLIDLSVETILQLDQYERSK